MTNSNIDNQINASAQAIANIKNKLAQDLRDKQAAKVAKQIKDTSKFFDNWNY